MSDDWTTGTGEYARPLIKAKGAEETAPSGPDPMLDIDERDLNVLDAYYHQLALDASADPRPNTAVEDEDDAWLVARARQRMSMTPEHVREMRARGRR